MPLLSDRRAFELDAQAQAEETMLAEVMASAVDGVVTCAEIGKVYGALQAARRHGRDYTAWTVAISRRFNELVAQGQRLYPAEG